MAGRQRWRTWARRVMVSIAVLALVLMIAVGVAALLIQTPWAKEKLRALMVRQANQYLTARLEIGHLEGSLFRDITLRDVRLTDGTRPLVAIDTVTVAYSIRQIWNHGVVIDRIRLSGPRITATRRADGRWDLASLVRTTAQEENRNGPRRPVHLNAIEIADGTIVLTTPVEFGAVHIPSRYEHLDARLRFDSAPLRWTLGFEEMRWRGADPDLTIDSLTGALGNGPHGFEFERLAVRTPRTAFTVNGTLHTELKPTGIDFDVHADRFAFQEWGGILHGLRNIAVDSGFDVALHGPLTAMVTDLRMATTGGAITGRLTLNTSIPGWRGRGAVDISRLDLARWLNRPDRPSDITGHVVFDLALRLGEGFPVGRYQFRGPHAGFMEYAADDVAARGQMQLAQVVVEEATARAYGSDLTTSGTIALDDPYAFHFAGTSVGLDLRRVPKSVPIPRVESTLAFDYDVRGQFARPFISGRARMATSTFLGATIADGTVGTIDSSAHPLRYSGDGAIDNVDLARFGAGLGIETLQQPRYRGRVSGRFTLAASGTNAEELDLHATGRLTRADVFDGALTDGAVRLDIANGTLAASYDGRFDHVNPAIPLADPRYDAALTGSGRVTATVRDLMLRNVTPADYDIDADLTFGPSTVRGVALEHGGFTGRFANEIVTASNLDVSGPAATIRGHGALAFFDAGASDFEYTIDRADLAQTSAIVGGRVAGQLTGTGRVTGPWAQPHLAGSATVLDFTAPGVYALSAIGDYDFDVAAGDPLDATARVVANARFLKLAGQDVQQAGGTVALERRSVRFDGKVTASAVRSADVSGEVRLAEDGHSVAIETLTLRPGGEWQLARAGAAPRVEWTDGAVSVDPMVFVGGITGGERLSIAGQWRPAGGGELRVRADNVRIESFEAGSSPRYAGLVNGEAVLRGSRETPIVTGNVAITNGRVDRFAYQKITGRVDYEGQAFAVDFRVDQAPGTWATAAGRVPLALFNRSLPDAPIDLRVSSSPIQLGLLEGLTTVVTRVSGEALVDVHAIGTARDPHFEGHVGIRNAAFLATASGVAYNNVSAAFALSRERITVESLHVEDTDHNPLDVSGSLATHELKVGDLAVTVRGHHFTVMRNELGRVAIDVNVNFGGRFETPELSGDMSISSGTLNVDEILERTLFRPYSTAETSIAPELDALVALNPWDRLRLDLALRVPDSLRATGENVQVTPGTPIGLGDVNLRVGGDLVLLKDPGAPLAVYGSFDRIAGTYAFQGRRFDVEPTSSINFRGGLSPEIYVTVARLIAGVEARVTITGPLGQPELHLASTPPLETADILSLIVFNTSVNDLTAVQQQELAIRAGTLAAGFLATPLVAALQNRLGLDVLEIAPSGEYSAEAFAPKVTIGEEIAPGLFARFSRQFGLNEYNQVELDYSLTRILQIRGTFSDAASLTIRSPFRRIERGGVDLLLFFSF